MQKAAASLEKNFQSHLDDLKNLIRIPSVSFSEFPKEEMRRGAEAVAAILRKRGLDKVELLEVGDAPPYVYAERCRAPGKPTVLLYAHYDVQPPGREELWKSPAFEPAQRPSPQGERLFGRGTADDKAGIIMHSSAIGSFLEAGGELPLNVKIVIEGEEEVGSPHLEEFIQRYRGRLDADVLVLTDTNNFDAGVPAVTVGLRGLVAVEVEVRALTKTVHSGMWGGPIPDPVVGLSKMLAGLLDDEGRIAVPGVMEQVRPLSADEIAEYKRIPFDEKDFRAQSGMIPSLKMLGDGPSPLAHLWRLPALTVTAIQASSRKMASNIINDVAWAKVTIRLVPDMDPEKVAHQLEEFLKSRAPWGLEVRTQIDAAGGAWAADVKGPAFAAIDAALERGYGVRPYKIGCGGSIGFVKPFADALGGAPAILIGVEDPYTNAHGENESLLVDDLRKACMSEVYFFTELAERWRK
ncbi:MAG: dipeptidase [Bdellovibrionales bacterium GWB1_55_8]|nr:MAG: dipeptidase [Bdellovibrionales bacterium GWB1_55_8]